MNVELFATSGGLAQGFRRAAIVAACFAASKAAAAAIILPAVERLHQSALRAFDRMVAVGPARESHGTRQDNAEGDQDR